MNTLHFLGSCKKAAKKFIVKDPIIKVPGYVLLAFLLGLILLVCSLVVTVNRQNSLIIFYQTENRELRFALEDLIKFGTKAEVFFEYISESQAINFEAYNQEWVRLEEANPNVPPLDFSMERYLILLQALLDVIGKDIEKDKERLAGYMERVYATPNLRPADGQISSGFGYRPSPFIRDFLSRHGNAFSFHSGVDIVGPEGSKIYATADGIVTFAAMRGSWGNLVIIDHNYGYQTYYAHLSGFAVSSGEKVRRGEVIGYMGSTGRVTGTHLHYEVRIHGQPVNPVRFFPENN
jgi:murein DD-endopeptidase MepM/ murein hydrolase activator NlpD